MPILPTAKAAGRESLQISLLTVEPRSNYVYTIYGHTALRLYDPSPDHMVDIVLNWGTFDSHLPGFLYRFMRGDADYFLSATNFSLFCYAYSEANATIVEQVLNIPEEGKERLIESVTQNLKEENLKYRYNFLFDNCTTRPRNLIEEACGKRLLYPEQKEKTTFRKLIHNYTYPYPWLAFGIDLVVGSGADSLLSTRNELFLPMGLLRTLNRSALQLVDGTKLPVVASSKIIIQSNDSDRINYCFWTSPPAVGMLLFVIYAIIAYWGWRKRRRFRGFFAPGFLVAALAGFIIGFLVLFSAHPCMFPNWNLLWLHPFQLIAFFGYFFKKSYRFISWYHIVNLVLLSALLFGRFWSPQVLNTANIPYICCLFLSSAYWLLIGKRITGKEK